MKIGNKIFKDKTYIMGILNITPDSFSDGGKYNCLDKALFKCEKMILDGADVIDIGGESTRPGHIKISSQEEIDRILPILIKIKNNFDIPISVDTYKSEVAEEVLKNGADLINDIWGLKWDEKIASIIKKYNASCCIMHNRNDLNYNDFLNDVKHDLEKSINIAKENLINDDKIVIDPGVGFAKTYEQNMKIVNNLAFFNDLNYPILLGTSKKSLIGISLNLPVDERLEGTLVTTVFAVLNKCLFVRVHDIIENKRTVIMTEKLIKEGK
jgi:dihydropteroate synthase